ncbi:CU044_5270 family protein [Spirillospora sp. CA-253888]
MNDLAPPPSRDLPPGRHDARRAHLLEEITTRRGPSAFGLPSRRRLLFGGLASAALAGGVTAALVLVPPGDGPPQMAQAGAVTVLNRAADAAAAEPELKLRPDQYLYVESKGRYGYGPGPKRHTHRQAWLSADGRHAGLIVQKEGGQWERFWSCTSGSGVNGDSRALNPTGPLDLRNPPTDCKDRPAVRTDLPTGTRAMRDWLYRNSEGENPPDVQAFITVGDTLGEGYLPPGARAAVFRAATTIPGVSARRPVTDLAGRTGVAVGQTWQGIRSELIFDARTYRLLGERTVVDDEDAFRPKGAHASHSPDAGLKLPQGTVTGLEANLRIAVTDRPGQAPGR